MADETAEVVRIDADAARLLSRLERISQILRGPRHSDHARAGDAVLQRLRAPARRAVARHACMLAEGDLSHRIAISGRDEFADLGQSFNRMAGRPSIASEGAAAPTPISRPWWQSAPRSCTRRTNHCAKSMRPAAAFFADISHELRTPLTVIRGEGEIALRGPNKRVAEYKHSIARIVEQAKHLSVLVNDLLFIARQGPAPRASTCRPSISAICSRRCAATPRLSPIRRRSNDLRQRQWARRACARRPGKAPATFPGALDNAVRYSNSKGEVKVEIASADGEVQGARHRSRYRHRAGRTRRNF